MKTYQITLTCALLLSSPSFSEESPANILPTEHPSPLKAPEISTFLHAISAAGLADIFFGTGPFTAFIPTNDAFEKWGKSRLDNLLKPENRDELVSFLTYHILHGKYLAQNLKTRTYRTLGGREMDVQVEKGLTTVNGAKVIKTDMSGPYGVIHEIDTVLEAPPH